MSRIGVVTFPGSLDDADALRAVEISGATPVSLWHASDSLNGVDAVVLPGGFSYGDYLRCGAIARFSPVMASVIDAANAGMPVLGICNGFQVICESHLLPGALIRNDVRTFVCRDQLLRVENTATAWTSEFTEGQEIGIVLKNGEGANTADDETLRMLEDSRRVPLPRQPERLPQRHRGHHERARQRRRPHAASRAQRRPAHRAVARRASVLRERPTVPRGRLSRPTSRKDRDAARVGGVPCCLRPGGGQPRSANETWSYSGWCPSRVRRAAVPSTMSPTGSVRANEGHCSVR